MEIGFQLLEALKTTGLLFWMTFWAFTLGYGLAAVIQTLVPTSSPGGCCRSAWPNRVASTPGGWRRRR